MSKALEALQKLRQNNIDNAHLFDDELLDVIETEIKRLQKLEKPKKIIGTITSNEATKMALLELCPDVAKQLKALEIIKRKRVDVELLMKTQNAKQYNKFSKNVNQSHNLGQREYDFLKEVLL